MLDPELYTAVGDRNTVIVIAACSADGKVLRPHMIMPGKTLVALRSYDLTDAPHGTVFSVSSRGWINEVGSRCE